MQNHTFFLIIQSVQDYTQSSMGEGEVQHLLRPQASYVTAQTEQDVLGSRCEEAGTLLAL